MEWLAVFSNVREQLSDLSIEINKTDLDIDHLVYELYNLTPDEIRIVEESFGRSIK